MRRVYKIQIVVVASPQFAARLYSMWTILIGQSSADLYSILVNHRCLMFNEDKYEQSIQNISIRYVFHWSHASYNISKQINNHSFRKSNILVGRKVPKQKKSQGETKQNSHIKYQKISYAGYLIHYIDQVSVVSNKYFYGAVRNEIDQNQMQPSIFICRTNQNKNHLRYDILLMSITERQAEKLALTHTFNAYFELGILRIKHEFKQFQNIRERLKNLFGSKQQQPVLQTIQKYLSRKQYLQAFAMITAVQFCNKIPLKSKSFGQFFKQIKSLFQKRVAQNLNNLQFIIGLEKRLEYSINQFHSWYNISQRYKHQNKQYPSSELSGKIDQASSKVYQLSPEAEKKGVWKQWLLYEAEQKKPNFQKLLKLAEKDNLKQTDIAIALIHHNKIKEAWKIVLKLKKTKSFISKYETILAMIDLHESKELIEYVKKDNLAQFEEKVLLQSAKNLIKKFGNESEEDKVKNYLNCIEEYQKYQCSSIQIYAYTKLIILLTASSDEQKDSKILDMYEKIIELVNIDESDYWSRRNKLNKYFQGALRVVLKQSQQNFTFLLKMQERYCSDPTIKSLIYLNMKNFNRVRVVSECCRIQGENVQEAEEAEMIAELMEKNKFEDLRKYMKSLGEPKQYSKKALRNRILEMAEKEEQSFTTIL